MKGYYIKAAQTLCGAGLFPLEFNEAFGTLLDQCPREDFDVVKHIVEKQLGCRMCDAFREFSEEAIAAASIGQVHFAELHDGTKVAVKVQYPEVEKYFYMDVKTVGFLAGVSGMGSKVKDVFAKLNENMEQEFDYTKEASIMKECVGHVLPSFGDRVGIPRPIDSDHPALEHEDNKAKSLCTRKVLTMERLDGTPIRKHTLQLMETFAGHFGTSVGELKELMTSTDPSKLDKMNPRIKEFFNMGPISENQSWGIRTVIRTRNFSAWLLSKMLSGCHCAPCEGLRPKLKALPVPLNGPRIAKLLFDVHGHEIFQNGLFNSDPHAGNVLMMKDGKLGLVDYGACMRLTKEQRICIARLLVAVADNDDDAVPMAFWACGFKSKKQDSRLALLLAHMSFNRGPYPEDLKRLAPIVGLPPEPTVMDLEAYVRGGKVDEIVSFPGHLVFLQRCCMVLSGIGMEMGAGRLSSAGMFKPQAMKLLNESVKTSTSGHLGDETPSIASAAIGG
jgi:aarF domain-containing kinase